MDFAQSTFKKLKKALGIGADNSNAKKEEENAEFENAINPFLVTQIYEDTPGKTPVSDQVVVWLEFTEDGIKMFNHTEEKKQISIFAFPDVKSYHHGTQQQLWGFEASSKEYPEITRFLFKTKHVAAMGEMKDEFMKKYCIKYDRAENLKKLEQERLEIERLVEERNTKQRSMSISTKSRSFSIKTPSSDKTKTDSPFTPLRIRAKTLLSKKPKGDANHIKKTFEKPVDLESEPEKKLDEDNKVDKEEEVKLDSSKANLLVDFDKPENEEITTSETKKKKKKHATLST